MPGGEKSWPASRDSRALSEPLDLATLDSYGPGRDLSLIPEAHFEILHDSLDFHETNTHIFVYARYAHGRLKCIDTFCYGGGWLTALEARTGEDWQSNQGEKCVGIDGPAYDQPDSSRGWTE